MANLKIKNNGKWEIVGTQIDPSLTIEGAAADAKATGVAINNAILYSKVQQLNEAQEKQALSNLGFIKQQEEPTDAKEGMVWIDTSDENGGIKIKELNEWKYIGKSIEVDTSLTTSGMAADAKTVGDKIAEVQDALSPKVDAQSTILNDQTQNLTSEQKNKAFSNLGIFVGEEPQNPQQGDWWIDTSVENTNSGEGGSSGGGIGLDTTLSQPGTAADAQAVGVALGKLEVKISEKADQNSLEELTTLVNQKAEEEHTHAISDILDVEITETIQDGSSDVPTSNAVYSYVNQQIDNIESIEIDNTLSVGGRAADSLVVGQALTEINSYIETYAQKKVTYGTKKLTDGVSHLDSGTIYLVYKA